jgi:bacteriorhodopsin
MILESGIFSLTIQFLVGVIDAVGLTLKVDPKDELLRDLLKVEMFVQVIEFAFYVWLILYFHKMSKNITPFRYLDWNITTPLMLITLMAFLAHRKSESQQSQQSQQPQRLLGFVEKESHSILKVVGLNAMMLACGLLGEFKLLSPLVSTALGFIPFTMYFSYIYQRFVPADDKDYKRTLYFWFVGFWALYGVFAVMNYTTKNIGYNILDLFAKNFFGVFLAYAIWSRSK